MGILDKLVRHVGKAIIDGPHYSDANPYISIERKRTQANRGTTTTEKMAASSRNVSEATDILKRIGHALSDLSVEEGLKEFTKGDHIATLRSVYSHHGIYDGNGYVYEYQDGRVQKNSLRDFAAGDKMYLVEESAKYSPSTIIDRARSRLGEQDYNVVYNNCENFATWCRRGE